MVKQDSISPVPCGCGDAPRVTKEDDGEWCVWCERFHQTEVFGDTRLEAIETWNREQAVEDE